MIINKKSFHYKLWLWTFAIVGDKDYVPNRTNLCSYVQRLIWMPLLVAFLWLLYGLATPFAFLFGNAPQNPFNDRRGDLWRSYPGLKVWGEVRVHPWVIALPAAIVYGEWAWFHYGSRLPQAIFHAFILLIFLVLFIIIWWHKSDTTHLIRKWVSAKKDGVCPLVEFKEEPSSKE